jgi:hypothetical protein
LLSQQAILIVSFPRYAAHLEKDGFQLDWGAIIIFVTGVA